MEITVAATVRKSSGRGEARRQRRDGMVPAVVYGACDPTPIACSARDLSMRLQDETFRSTLLTLDIDGKKVPALLRDVQMHPFKRDVLHVDFQAVKADQEIAASVPLHYINVEESPGVKLRHAIFTTIENQVALHCLPKDLPEYISIDVSGLDLGDTVHLSDITPPTGVRFDAITRGEDPALAIMASQAAEEPETDPAAETTEDAAGSDT